MYTVESCANSSMEIRNKILKIEGKGLEIEHIIPYPAFTLFVCKERVSSRVGRPPKTSFQSEEINDTPNA